MNDSEKCFIMRSYKSRIVTSKDVMDDAQRFRKIRNCLSRLESDEQVRLLMNQLIIVFNTFEIENALMIIESCVGYESWPVLYGVLRGIGFHLPEHPFDFKSFHFISNWMEGNKYYEEIFKSFRGRQRSGLYNFGHGLNAYPERWSA